MKQPESLELVSDFHRTFRHPILSEPTIPDESRCRLRVELLAEEVRELEEAVLANDLVAVADALCDIQYVLSGAVLEFGLGNKFEALFQEVQRSNMSKACATEEEAKRTVDFYRTSKATECHYEQAGDMWLVYRTADRKTLKSIAYSPADLEPILKS